MSNSYKCIVCRGTSKQDLYKGVIKCTDCGYVCANLDITDEELLGLYNKDFFFNSEYVDYTADRKQIQKNLRLRLEVIKKFLAPNRRKTILEIGCAFGFFLEVTQEVFDAAIGIDIVEDGIRYAKEQLGLNAVQGDFLTHNFGEQKFDAVCMWDTIEHLRNPHLYLEKISTHTESGALLAFTTGDIDSLNARIRKDKWRFLIPPIHLHFFSKKVLTKMLDNYGFDIVHSHYSGYYHSIDNIAHKLLVLDKRGPSFYNFLKKSLPAPIINLCLYINLFDIMFIIARKR
jgi:SAM-dependent methyltransferase